MPKNVHKYYLSVDGQIIDFKSIGNFKNMEDFLNLSIFTGIFSSKKSLINALNSIGFIFEHRFYQNEVTIVKRVGNEKDGYSYQFVTDRILYRKTFDYFLSKNNLSKFLYINRDCFDAMEQLFELYSSELKKLIYHFKLKIRLLKNQLDQFDDQETREELRSKNNSLNNFVSYHADISRILFIIRSRRTNQVFDPHLEREYIELLIKFVEHECNYIRDGKVTPNNRGFIKLALNISEFVEYYPELEMPSKCYMYHKRQSEMLKIMRDVAILIDASRQNFNPSIDTETEDPDNYMFLEGSDYMNLLGELDSPKIVESVMCDIENLQAKKGTF